MDLVGTGQSSWNIAEFLYSAPDCSAVANTPTIRSLPPISAQVVSPDSGFDSSRCNYDMRISNGGKTLTKSPAARDLASCFGTPVVSRGKASWTIKIDSGQTVENVMIGVAQPTLELSDCEDFYRMRSVLPGKAWWIKNAGNTTGRLPDNVHPFGKGDTVRMDVDLDAGTIEFRVNGELKENGLTQKYVQGPVALWVNLNYDETISITSFSAQVSRGAVKRGRVKRGRSFPENLPTFP